MDIRECYHVFELPNRSPLQEVEATYEKLARIWHPDRIGNAPELQQAAQEKLRRINEAYNELKASFEDGAECPPDGPKRLASDQIACYRSSCKYLGSDDRLKTLSSDELTGRDASVEVAADGVAILTRDSAGPDEAAYYPANSIIWLRQGKRAWCRPDDPEAIRRAEYPQEVRFKASDPESDLADSFFVVELRFSNNYYRELFLKRMAESLGFLEKSQIEAQKRGCALTAGIFIAIGMMLSTLALT